MITNLHMSILHGCTKRSVVLWIPKGTERRQENKLRLLRETSQNYLNDSHLHFNFNATVLNIVKGKKFSQQKKKKKKIFLYFILNPVSDTIYKCNRFTEFDLLCNPGFYIFHWISRWLKLFCQAWLYLLDPKSTTDAHFTRAYVFMLNKCNTDSSHIFTSLTSPGGWVSCPRVTRMNSIRCYSGVSHCPWWRKAPAGYYFYCYLCCPSCSKPVYQEYCHRTQPKRMRHAEAVTTQVPKCPRTVIWRFQSHHEGQTPSGWLLPHLILTSEMKEKTFLSQVKWIDFLLDNHAAEDQKQN